MISIFLLTPSQAASDISHYPRMARPSADDRVLIVAPHIDDEAIGAGGYALEAIETGAKVFVVFLTAGDCSRISARLMHRKLDPDPADYLAVGRARIAEAREAMRIAGIAGERYFVLGYPDRGLGAIVEHRTETVRSIATGRSAVPYEEALTPGAPYCFASLMRDLERVFDAARPTIVIAPVAFDRHPDHRAAAALVDVALERARSEAARYGYLVHSGWKSLVPLRETSLAPPKRMREMTWAVHPLSTEMQSRKETLLQVYRSQGPILPLLRNTFVRANELFFAPLSMTR
ncbi:MAG TPA: PIG-L family deacetylase [Thermoanaerobaculia bacterium]|nr:PIG-L family deacetylase [Thermoanaerobaculia bacterium]